MAIFTWGLVLPGSDHCITYLYSGFIGTKGEVAKKTHESYQSLSYIFLSVIKSTVVILVLLWWIVSRTVTGQ